MNPDIILASSSRYRQSLLKKIKIDFTAVSPGTDESLIIGESPMQSALRLAKEKASAVQGKYSEHLIIGSDQIAILENQQLEKPGNRNNTIQQLMLISGKKVSFYTSVCVLNSATQENICDVDICSVWFRNLSKQQIENYVDLDKPYDCAGGFKSEGLGIALFNKFKGDDPNALIGLPVIKLIHILERFGVKII